MSMQDVSLDAGLAQAVVGDRAAGSRALWQVHLGE